MKAYLIDPDTQTISEVEYTGDYTNIYEHIGADMFDVARLYPNGDGAFVDDNGLSSVDLNFWVHRNYPQPLAGKGLLLGVNAEGESISPQTDLETLRKDIAFVSRQEIVAMIEMRKFIEQMTAAH